MPSLTSKRRCSSSATAQIVVSSAMGASELLRRALGLDNDERRLRLWCLLPPPPLGYWPKGEQVLRVGDTDGDEESEVLEVVMGRIVSRC